MAGGWTQNFNQDVMQTVVNDTAAPSPLANSTWWLHLYASTLNDTATPATTGRCGGDNYNPQSVTNSTAFWTNPGSASTSSVQNNTAVTYTTSASTGWGTLQALLITSSSGTGGRAYYWSDLSTDQTVASGNTVSFSTGTIVLKSLSATG